jgi:hypothetical protein
MKDYNKLLISRITCIYPYCLDSRTWMIVGERKERSWQVLENSGSEDSKSRKKAFSALIEGAVFTIANMDNEL